MKTLALTISTLLLGCQDFGSAYNACVASGNCEGDAGQRDAGPPDAGDSGSPDASSPDAGPPDAGPFDGGGCWCVAIQEMDAGTFFYDVWGKQAGDVWTGGTNGELLHLVDGGVVFSDPGDGTHDIYAINGLAAPIDDFWISGKGGYLVNQHGGTFTDQTVDMSGYYSCVWEANLNHVWAVGAVTQGGLPIGDDVVGGNLFSPLSSNGEGLNAVWGNKTENFWGVGYGGTVLHYDGGSWAVTAFPNSANLYAVWGNADNDVWIVGDTATVAHFDGTLWTNSANPIFNGTSMRSVRGTTASDVWVAALSGEIFHYDGASWRLETTLPIEAFKMWVFPTEVWVAGGTSAGQAILIRHPR